MLADSFLQKYIVLPCGTKSQDALPFMHSVVHRFRHWSFQSGTWWTCAHTFLWQASMHASSADVPQTVTQLLGVGSLDRLPMRFISLADVQTRSHTKLDPGKPLSS
eukprot:scaffold305093_cov44-Prasinocladus_malaysianus.AAC.1